MFNVFVRCVYYKIIIFLYLNFWFIENRNWYKWNHDAELQCVIEYEYGFNTILFFLFSVWIQHGKKRMERGKRSVLPSIAYPTTYDYSFGFLVYPKYNRVGRMNLGTWRFWLKRFCFTISAEFEAFHVE